MNNFTFGNARHQYYETIAGGAGAGPDFDGASAVQTHMTNSRLTDPEMLETRFPVLLERFAIRRGSGGAGAHRGGDGVDAPHPLPRADAAPASSPTAAGWRRAGSRAAATRRPGVNQVIRADGREETADRHRLGRDGGGRRVRDRDAGGGGYGEISGGEGRSVSQGVHWVRGEDEPISPPARHPGRRPRLRAAVQSDAGRHRRGAGHRAARRAGPRSR